MNYIPKILLALGWNKRLLNFSDFEALCEHLGIAILRENTKTPGMYFVRDDKPYIGLSTKLSGVQLWFTAWHEMAHHLLHAPGLRCFSPGSVSKAEAEAEAIAICALIDENTLYRIIRYGELHDFPRKLLMKRLRILERYGF
ncbi:MAG TPA: ImmA/IrrE family metallo-endopeptidase [Pyrinomonadaceae bacterium]